MKNLCWQLIRGRKGKRELETCFDGCELLLVKMILMLIGGVMRETYGGVNDNAKGQAGSFELNNFLYNFIWFIGH